MNVRARLMLISVAALVLCVCGVYAVSSGAARAKVPELSRKSTLQGLSWSPSGRYLLACRMGGPHDVFVELLCVDVNRHKVKPIVQGIAVGRSYAWSGVRDEVSYWVAEPGVVSPVRVLRTVSPSGQKLHRVEVPYMFMCLGIVGARNGNTVMVDAGLDDTERALEHPLSEGGYVKSITVRVFTDNLKKKREFRLPIRLTPVCRMQTDPLTRGAMLVPAVKVLSAGRDRYTVITPVSINLADGKTKEVAPAVFIYDDARRWAAVGGIDRLGAGAKPGYDVIRPVPYRTAGGDGSGTDLCEVDARTAEELPVFSTEPGGHIYDFDAVRGGIAVATSEGVFVFPLTHPSGGYPPNWLSSHRLLPAGRYPGVSLSPDGKKVAVIRNRNELLILDVKTGKTDWSYMPD